MVIEIIFNIVILLSFQIRLVPQNTARTINATPVITSNKPSPQALSDANNSAAQFSAKSPIQASGKAMQVGLFRGGLYSFSIGGVKSSVCEPSTF